MIRSVLFGLQSYWAQLFLHPQKVMKLIEAVCRSYLWSGSTSITKRALVSWKKTCIPKSDGGLNLINFKVWNQAAICKHLWALSQKKDKLWIAWVHSYYIKDKCITDMIIPPQCSWMIKKILTMRKHLSIMGYWSSVTKMGKFSIKEAYKLLSGQHSKVPWKNLICSNPAPPKATFILWLVMMKRVRTKDLLFKWGIVNDVNYSLCISNNEDFQHLFFCCSFTQQVWSGVLNWLQMGRVIIDWEQECKWILQTTKGKSAKAQSLKMCFTIAIYMIWLERNACEFQRKRPDPSFVIREIKYICLARCRRVKKIHDYLYRF